MAGNLAATKLLIYQSTKIFAKSRLNLQFLLQSAPRFNGLDPRENPLLFHSALDSRSADTRDYPLLWGHYGREPQSALEPVKSTGMHMIKPPAKKKKKPTEYFYYSEDSPHYKDKLSKRPNKEEHEVDNEIISIDGIIVGPRNSLTTPKPPTPRVQQQPPQSMNYFFHGQKKIST